MDPLATAFGRVTFMTAADRLPLNSLSEIEFRKKLNKSVEGTNRTIEGYKA